MGNVIDFRFTVAAYGVTAEVNIYHTDYHVTLVVFG